MKFFKRRNGRANDAQPAAETLAKTTFVPMVSRLSFPALEDLETTFTHPDLEPVRCRLVEMSVEGAGLNIPSDYDPELVGESLAELTIFSPVEDWNVQTPVRARKSDVQADERFVRYDVDFIDAGNLFAELHDSMGSYFNRRRGERVSPDVSPPLTVLVVCGAERIEARMQDVSVSGLGVAVDQDQAALLEPGAEVALSFGLPWQSGQLAGMGVVRRRESLRDLEHVGIQFDYGRSPGLIEHRGVLEAFVAERLQAMHDVRGLLKS